MDMLEVMKNVMPEEILDQHVVLNFVHGNQWVHLVVFGKHLVIKNLDVQLTICV